MTLDEMKTIFDDAHDEFLHFERVATILSTRPDLHAFMRLDKLCHGEANIVSDAHHDEFYLSIDPSKLATVASKDDIIELIRCGVRYDDEWDTLAMFT